MKVLLVDDEQELVSALAERLSFRGVEADWVTSGRAALERIETQCYDLGILDVKMPGIGGIELERRLSEKCPQMKFLFLTGHGSMDDFKEATAETGESFYLVKPVRLEDLMAKMEEALNRQD